MRCSNTVSLAFTHPNNPVLERPQMQKLITLEELSVENWDDTSRTPVLIHNRNVDNNFVKLLSVDCQFFVLVCF